MHVVACLIEFKSVTQVQHEFRTPYNRSSLRPTFYEWYNGFMMTGRVLRKPKSGSRNRNFDDVNQLQETFRCCPLKLI